MAIMMAMKRYMFSARIQPADGGGAYVLFPFDVTKEFGTKGRVPVRATFDGVHYTGSLLRYGHPQHMLPVLKRIREHIGKGPGSRVDVVLWKDGEIRSVEVPESFAARLRQEELLPAFEKLSYSHQREYCRWVTEAKKEETRARRLDKAVEMLRSGIRTPG